MYIYYMAIRACNARLMSGSENTLRIRKARSTATGSDPTPRIRSEPADQIRAVRTDPDQNSRSWQPQGSSWAATSRRR